MNDLHGLFADPPKRYRPYPIVHNWPSHDRTTLMDAIAAYGFGGVVTNVPFKDGFTQNPANLAEFPKILAELEARGLAYWLYDENGYPSGYVGGATLEGHPELAARGFYMRRRAAYEEPMHIRFRTEDPGDEIIWAAKYPIKVTPRKDKAWGQANCDTFFGEEVENWMAARFGIGEGRHMYGVHLETGAPPCAMPDSNPPARIRGTTATTARSARGRIVRSTMPRRSSSSGSCTACPPSTRCASPRIR